MTNIDPLISLAFSVSSAKGTYGLFLGSGISFSSGIPTGWAITEDLITKYAESLEIDEPDVVEWYKREVGEPSYSELLEHLFPSAENRSLYLRKMIEAPLIDPEAGAGPTPAHHAIADLIADGYFKVVITTNFDRLLEQALESRGVRPTVIFNEDSATGAIPYVHSACTILKIHGDYLDVRSLNTAEELKNYPPVLNELLDRWMDEFGWIICGWSADWDYALVDAWMRCSTRRFRAFWTRRSALGDNAKRIVSARDAIEVKIGSADDFFPQLRDKIRAIEDSQRPHPREVDLLVAQVKRFSSDRRYEIQLFDLVNEEVRRVRDGSSFDEYPVSHQLSKEAYQERVEKFELLTTPLLNIVAHGMWWTREWSEANWPRCISQLSRRPQLSGSFFPNLTKLARYPSLLCFYAAGVAALASGHWRGLGTVLGTVVIADDGRQERPVVTSWSALSIVSRELMDDKQYAGPSYRIRDLLQPIFAQYLTDEEFDQTFDRFEYLTSVVAELSGGRWLGRFTWFLKHGGHEAEEWLQTSRVRESAIAGGLFENDEALERGVALLTDVAKQLQWH